jgi:bifunctional non-homologous end joining protein LigD
MVLWRFNILVKENGMALVEKISLYFKQANSDKYYNIAIEEVEDGFFMVPFTYGRRGTSGQSGSKTSEPVPYDVAKKTYDKVVKQKKGKGYQVGTGPGGSGTSGISQAVSTVHAGITVEKVDSGIFPQLLCPIEDDEVELFLKDPRYGAQEKKDGRRKFMQRNADGTNASINRKGQVVGYPAIFDPACEAAIKSEPFYSFTKEGMKFLIDGEEVDDTLHVFDILEYGSFNMRDKPYQDRYNVLYDIIRESEECAFKLVPLAVTEAEKRALYEKLKKEKKEGIIFKLLDAPYVPGRFSETFVTYTQNCPQVKNKFYATASCIVIRVNEKRSIGLGLYDGKELIDIGNCTIPPNKEIPSGIVEIRYLYAYKGGSLYQPTYLEPRDDIDENACLISQLKYKSEEK